MIRAIDERLAMPVPEAANPLSQTKLEVIWGLYREAIIARQTNAAAQCKLYAHTFTALTDGSSLEAGGELLATMQSQLILFVKNKATFERVKARIIDERKVLRIELIRSTLRSLRSIDSTQLSRS